MTTYEPQFSSEFLSHLQNRCPELIPSEDWNSTFLQVVFTAAGVPNSCFIFTDLEVPEESLEYYKKEVLTLVAGSPSCEDSLLQFHFQCNKVTPSVVKEKKIAGTIKSMAFNYITIKAKNKEIAGEQGDEDVTIGALMSMERAEGQCFRVLHKSLTAAEQTSSASLRTNASYQPYESRTVPAEYGINAPNFQGGSGYPQQPSNLDTYLPAQDNSSEPVFYPPNEGNAASLPAQMPIYSEDSPEFQSILHENVDLSSIDVEVYPTTSGEQRLPILSLSKWGKFSSSQAHFVKQLSARYTHWRRSRGDGNCYYRAVAIAYLEHLCRGVMPVGYFESFVFGLESQSLAWVIPEYARQYKYFLKEAKALLDLKRENCDLLPHIPGKFQERKFDLAAVVAFRGIAIASFNHLMETNADFSAFLDMPADEYHTAMRTLGTEAFGLSFRAMSHGLDAKIVHISLSPHTCREDTFTPGTPGGKVVLHVLYKQGHYDILYPISVQKIDQYIYATNNFRYPVLGLQCDWSDYIEVIPT